MTNEHLIRLRNWLYAFRTRRPLAGFFHLPRYFREWRRYSQMAGPGAPRLGDAYPCLDDWGETTPFDPHYFYQGAWLARSVAARHPAQHVDVGSSVLMLSVLSATTETLHIDYRPLQAQLRGLRCEAGDILDLKIADASIESLSCLHVIEHIGLGRYGDPIDPDGSRKAAAQLARVLARGGRLYLSTPVGRERVCFNAHRVFAPETIVSMLAPLRLDAFSLTDDAGTFRQSVPLEAAQGLDYGCGMFEFTRVA
ncbi:MAG: DUF268 domain-containing protein [Candidatus Parcubacteria bacterium]|nr:DUF268 domain-containing protein [Burkholderiales bacterium]